jgi:preprotein translocase subunit SecD
MHRRELVLILLSVVVISTMGCAPRPVLPAPPSAVAPQRLSMPSLEFIDPASTHLSSFPEGAKLVPGHDVLLSGSSVTSMSVIQPPAPGSRYSARLQLDAAGTARWSQITKDYVGKQVVIALGGVVLAAPIVNTPIPDGIIGFYTDKAGIERLNAALKPAQ